MRSSDVAAATPPTRPLTRFARDDVVCEGWYAVASGRDVPRSGTATASIGRHGLVLFRDAEGAVHALDRSCGHLGADLAKGDVVGGGLRCAFHHWRWGPDGRCVAGAGASLGRRTGGYVVRERWGCVWVWAGGAPAYELPEPSPDNSRRVLRLPSQRIDCHPHVVLGNGLDVTHVVPVHNFRFDREPRVDLDPPHRLTVEVTARFGATTLRTLLGLAGRKARWRFTTIGPSLAWVEVLEPTPFELVWAARPLPGGGCSTQTVFFLPRRRTFVQAVPMMLATTIADRAILEGVRFRPNFVESDALFALYCRLIESMDVWDPAGEGPDTPPSVSPTVEESWERMDT